MPSSECCPHIKLTRFRKVLSGADLSGQRPSQKGMPAFLFRTSLDGYSPSAPLTLAHLTDLNNSCQYNNSGKTIAGLFSSFYGPSEHCSPIAQYLISGKTEGNSREFYEYQKKDKTCRLFFFFHPFSKELSGFRHILFFPGCVFVLFLSFSSREHGGSNPHWLPTHLLCSHETPCDLLDCSVMRGYFLFFP